MTVFYFVLVLLPGGLGAGDVKLAAPIGLCLDYRGLGTVVIATLAGTLLAARYVTVARHRIRSTDAVACGPAMILGALVAVLISR